MTTLSMGTKTWVLLNSRRVVREIMGKRAAITHERPSFPIAGGLVSRNNRRLFLQKTEDWKHGRRVLHRALMGPAAKHHGDIIEDVSLGFLWACLNYPEAWVSAPFHFSASQGKIFCVENEPLEWYILVDNAI